LVVSFGVGKIQRLVEVETLEGILFVVCFELMAGGQAGESLSKD